MDIAGVSGNTIGSGAESIRSQAKSTEFEQQLERAYSQKDEEQLKSACKEFEQILLSMLYKQMRASIPKSDLVERSFAMETFEGMLDDRVTEEAVKGTGIGLGNMLYNNLVRTMRTTYKPVGDSSNEKTQNIHQQQK